LAKPTFQKRDFSFEVLRCIKQVQADQAKFVHNVAVTLSQGRRSMPDPGMAATHVLHVDGMACSGCVERVENAIRATPGVVSVAVDLETKQAKVTFAGAPNLEAVANAVRQAGYEPVKG
jgi:copper chaperone CopZ